MMNNPEDKSHIQLNNLLYSCVYQKQRGLEQFVHEHVLGYVKSGEIHLQTATGIQVIKEGAIALIRRKYRRPAANSYRSIYSSGRIFCDAIVPNLILARV